MSAPDSGIGISNPETGLAGGGQFIDASEKGQPNGLATLDGSGKIPTGQLPVGDVTYLGNWNAATNTPTLANSVGTAGDLYICDVAGSQNLGGGVVAYGVSDWLIYDGTVWDRVPGNGVVAANPTATVGVAATNGVATTFMRSDAAPALAPAFLATLSRIVAADGKTNQNADINMPTLYAVPVSGMYRVSAYMVQTVAATTSSVLPSLNVQYTEATTGVGMSDQLFTSSNLNQVGAHQRGDAVILAQQGSSIGYVTGNYASVGATAMRYAVQLKIEFLG